MKTITFTMLRSYCYDLIVLTCKLNCTNSIANMVHYSQCNIIVLTYKEQEYSKTVRIPNGPAKEGMAQSGWPCPTFKEHIAVDQIVESISLLQVCIFLHIHSVEVVCV